MSATAKERMEFTLKLRDELPALSRAEVEDFAAWLMRKAVTHGRMQERRCSDPAWGEADETREERLETQVEEKCKQHGLPGVIFGGDPRGYTVRLILPGRRGNTWGGDDEGWGVPQ